MANDTAINQATLANLYDMAMQVALPAERGPVDQLRQTLQDIGYPDVPDSNEALTTLAQEILDKHGDYAATKDVAEKAANMREFFSQQGYDVLYDEQPENANQERSTNSGSGVDQASDQADADGASEGETVQLDPIEVTPDANEPAEEPRTQPVKPAEKPADIADKQAAINDTVTEVTQEVVTQAQSYLYALGHGEQLEYMNSAGEAAYIDGLAGGSTRAALEAYVESNADLEWSDYADLSTEQIIAQLHKNLETSVAEADRGAVYDRIDELANGVNVEAAQHAINAVLQNDETVQLAEGPDIGNNDVLLTDGALGNETQAGLEAMGASVNVGAPTQLWPAPDIQEDQQPDSSQAADTQAQQAAEANAANAETPSLSFDFAKAHKLVTDQARMDEAHSAVTEQLGGVEKLPDGVGYLTTVDAPGWFTGKVPVIVSSDGFVRQIDSQDDIPENTIMNQDIEVAIKQKIVDAANTGKDPNLDSFARDDAIERVVGDDNIVELHGVPFKVNVSENPNAHQDFEVTVTGVAEDFERDLNEDLQPDAVLHLADGRSVYINDLESLQKVAQGIKGEFDEASALAETVYNLDNVPEGSLRAEFGPEAHGTTAVIAANGETAELNVELAQKIADELKEEQGAPTVEPGRENEPSFEFG